MGVIRVLRNGRYNARCGVLACIGLVARWAGSTLGGATVGGTLGSDGIMCTLGGVWCGICLCGVGGFIVGALATVGKCGSVGTCRTLGVAGGVVTCRGADGNDVCFAGGVVCRVNISASLRSACIWSSAMGAKGAAGCGLSNAEVSWAAASRAASAELVVGISYRYGKNSTVRAILSDRVFVI